MFAVIKTGGKQYRVAPDDKLKVARLDGEPGTIVSLTEVLMVGGDSPVVGNRYQARPSRPKWSSTAAARR